MSVRGLILGIIPEFAKKSEENYEKPQAV